MRAKATADILTLPGQDLGTADRRQALAQRVRGRWPHATTRDEVAAHFDSMPERYWLMITEPELLADVAAAHAFLCRLEALQDAIPHVAVVWRHFPDEGFTRVRVCTWNRHGLLAKIAAAFSALRLNILRADVYTRADDLVLDVFDVCDTEGRHVTDTNRLEGLAFLIEGALRQPPRFASVWSAEFHKLIPGVNWITPRVGFDNRVTDHCITIHVEASDRPGLLYDILKSLTDCGLNITQAVINTVDGVAHDAFQVTGPEGERVLDVTQQEQVRSAVTAAIAG